MTTGENQAIFFAECEESLAAAEAGLAACKAGTQNNNEDSGDPFDLASMLDDITGAMEAPKEELAAPSWLIKLRPHAGAMRNGGEPLLLLRELAALGARCVACDCGAVPPLANVIKSLDTHYRSVEAVSGATILGDGMVALIVDLDSLVARTLSGQSLAAQMLAEAA